MSDSIPLAVVPAGLDRPSFSRDDAFCDRRRALGKRERIPDGEHLFADLDLAGKTQGDGFHGSGRMQLEQCHVVGGIAADKRGWVSPLLSVKRHLDLGRVRHNVVVRQDLASSGEDHPRPLVEIGPPSQGSRNATRSDPLYRHDRGQHPGEHRLDVVHTRERARVRGEPDDRRVVAANDGCHRCTGTKAGRGSHNSGEKDDRDPGPPCAAALRPLARRRRYWERRRSFRRTWPPLRGRRSALGWPDAVFKGPLADVTFHG